jgi:hypothetical protein
MSRQYQSLEETAAERIEEIESTIAALSAKIQQIKGNGVAHWGQAGDLGYVEQQLDVVAKFWRV